MSGFSLVPVDGGDPVHLPQGETVLGRGPFLGISDKRVSRHHGLLENRDGELRLKPTHLNPCFVQASPADEPRPLVKDCWHRLQDGELLSLLPGHHVYRVEAAGGEERTPRNSQMLEEQKEEPSAAGPAPSDQSGTPRQEVQHDVAATRRRVLPAWMMTAVASSSPKAVKQSKQPAASKPAAAKQAPPPATSSPEGAGLSEEDDEAKRPKKKRREMNDEERRPQIKTARSDESTFRDQSGPGRAELSDTSNMEDPAEGESGALTRNVDVSQSDEDKKSRNKQNGGRSESDGSNRSSASKPRVRTPCPYGKDCYRKNPLHFQECSHPGDTDYEEEEEEEEADRPECPYGTDCYRKNPLHRKEFRHTKRPARSTRTVTRAAPGEDEDEYDDSFIDDDSEDIGNDSDYVPHVSDDSDKEDVKQLQREAKAFLKRKM